MQASHTARATLVLSAFAALQFALFLGYFPWAIIITPYGDVLDWLNGFYALPEQSLWQYLWAPHNGHRLVFSKLLTVSDAKLFGGLSYPIAAVCLSLFLLAAGVALAAIHRSLDHIAVRHWVTAVAVLLLFPTASYASFAYPVNSQHMLVSVFVFLACALIARSAAVRDHSKSQHYGYLFLAAMVGVCASLTALNGLIVWPLLLWMAWALRMARVYVVAMATLGALVIIGFSYQYPISSESQAAVNGLSDIPHIAKYLVEYHGMPWVEIGSLYWPAMMLGLAILWLSVFFCIRGLLTSRAQPPVAVVAIAMLTFSLVTAVMIAVGRHQLDLLPAHRYAIFVVITYVALFVLNIPNFARWMGDSRRAAITVSATLLFALAYLGQQVVVGQFAVQRANSFAHYEKEFLAGGRTPVATTALYFPSIEVLEERYKMLEKERIYMFRPR